MGNLVEFLEQFSSVQLNECLLGTYCVLGGPPRWLRGKESICKAGAAGLIPESGSPLP